MSKFYVYLENGKEILDPKFDSYNPGTQMLLETFDEQGMEWEDIEDYTDTVEFMEELKSVDEAERFIYGMGTDYIDEMELHRDWENIMFPRAEKSPYLNQQNNNKLSLKIKNKSYVYRM